MDRQQFQNPDSWCRGTDFWMLNDRLEEAELRRQLRQLHGQGIASVIVRTYIGLKSDYPGPDWRKKMRAAVEEAKALGMTLFMQAGYMPEAVLDLPQAFSLMNLRPFPKGEGAGRLMCSHGDLDYRLVYSGTILDMLSPDAMDFYIKQSYEDMWSSFRSEFGKTIVSMWVDEPSYAHVSIPWTPALPEAYRRMWGESFPEKQAWLLFEDGEGAFLLRHRFWRVVLKMIQAAYFTKVRDWCHANGLLFSGHLMAEDTLQSQIQATCFTMPCYRYFDLPGTDHLTAFQDWRYGEIRDPEGWDGNFGYSRYVTPLQCSSASHQAGKETILCEMYGVSTENLGLRDQRAMFDMFAALGINHRSVHGIFYSLRGRGKRAYPPHISDYQPYWPAYHLLTDTLAREARFLRSGRPVRELMVLHPMDSAFGLYKGYHPEGPRPDLTDIRRESRRLYELMRALTGWQCSFELGDEECLEDMGRVEQGRLAIGAMDYSAVLLPHLQTLRSNTLELLSAFGKAGGRILVLGPLPERLDGLFCPELSKQLKALPGLIMVQGWRELKETLDALPVPYRLEPIGPCPELQVHYREDGNQKLLFLHNNNYREGCRALLHLPGKLALTQWQPETGDSLPFACRWEKEETLAECFLPEGGTLLLSAQPQESLPLFPKAKAQRTFPPILRWQVTRHHPNVLLLEQFRFSRGEEPLSEQSVPILAIQEQLAAADYRGPITLSCSFETRMALKGARLACESPSEQSFFLDGAPLSHQPNGCWLTTAFETLSLPDIAPGRHSLTVSRYFEPLKKPLSGVTSLFENLPGVELEGMMLLGEFGVASAAEPGPRGILRLEPDFILKQEQGYCFGELSSEGYPFYAGEITLSAQVELTQSQIQKEIFLCLDGLYAPVAEVRINGQKEGSFTWAPYRVKLSHAQAGENLLEIRLFSTLRNLLGPWHRVKGEIGEAWGGYELPNLPWLGAVRDGKPAPGWEWDRMPDHSSWTDRYLVLPFGVVQPRLTAEED